MPKPYPGHWKKYLKTKEQLFKQGRKDVISNEGKKKRQTKALLIQEGYRNKGVDKDKKEERKIDFTARVTQLNSGEKNTERKEGNR